MKHQTSEIHPELQSLVKRIKPFTFNSKNLWMVRLITNYLFLWHTLKIPDNVLIENIFIPNQDGKSQIRLHIYRPKLITAPTPILFWLHGGVFTIGKPEIDDELCIRYASELGIVIVSIDYRLAPKYPFPTPLDDSFTALKWVESHAQQLNIDSSRMAIGGESVGAGIAASLVQLVYDRNGIKPVFQLLLYPMLDDRTTFRTDIVNNKYILWNMASNQFGWESYLGDKFGSNKLPQYAVPSRREDLSGLPPTWIGVGSLDLFYDEDVTYAERLKDCGVDCEMVVVPGAFHRFDVYAPQAEVVQNFRKSQIAALKRYLFPAKSTF